MPPIASYPGRGRRVAASLLLAGSISVASLQPADQANRRSLGAVRPVQVRSDSFFFAPALSVVSHPHLSWTDRGQRTDPDALNAGDETNRGVRLFIFTINLVTASINRLLSLFPRRITAETGGQSGGGRGAFAAHMSGSGGCCRTKYGRWRCAARRKSLFSVGEAQEADEEEKMYRCSARRRRRRRLLGTGRRSSCSSF